MATNKVTKNTTKQGELSPDGMPLSRGLMDAFGPIVGLAKICHCASRYLPRWLHDASSSMWCSGGDKVLRSDRLHIHAKVAVARIPSPAAGEISGQSMKTCGWITSHPLGEFSALFSEETQNTGMKLKFR